MLFLSKMSFAQVLACQGLLKILSNAKSNPVCDESGIVQLGPQIMIVGDYV